MKDKKQTISVCSSRTAIVTSLIVIGAIAFYNWCVSPHRNYLMAAQRQESTATDLMKKNKIIDHTVIAKQKNLKELKKKFDQAYTKVFSRIEAAEFLGSIQTIVENANCTVNTLKYLPAESKPKGDKPENSYISTQQAKLSISGSYSAITLLMNKLQNSSKQVQVDDVAVKLITSDSGLLKCDMNITIYVMQDKEIKS